MHKGWGSRPDPSPRIVGLLTWAWGPSSPVAPPCRAGLARGGAPNEQPMDMGTVLSRRPDVRSRFGRPGEHPMGLGTVRTGRGSTLMDLGAALTRSLAQRAGSTEPGRAHGMEKMGALPRRTAYPPEKNGIMVWGPVRVPVHLSHTERPSRPHEGCRKRHPLNDHPLRIELDVIVL